MSNSDNAMFYCPECHRSAMRIDGDGYNMDGYGWVWEWAIFYCPKCCLSWDMGDDYSEILNLHDADYQTMIMIGHNTESEFQEWLNRHHQRGCFSHTSEDEVLMRKRLRLQQKRLDFLYSRAESMRCDYVKFSELDFGLLKKWHQALASYHYACRRYGTNATQIKGAV